MRPISVSVCPLAFPPRRNDVVEIVNVFSSLHWMKAPRSYCKKWIFFFRRRAPRSPPEHHRSRSAESGHQRPISVGISPPPTDVGSMPLSWASFNNAPRRIQNGGWAREVTQSDFAVADTISGVNMRLTSGGIREMHWHQFAEWAYVTYGSCRITILDQLGRPYIADVKEGDLWYFPAGLPHSLQGIGQDGCEFVICFDEGKASGFSTLLVTEWFTHTPPNILGENFGVPAETFANIPLRASTSSRATCQAIWRRIG
jgi:oxalate decarboxylase family bicupin protein